MDRSFPPLSLSLSQSSPSFHPTIMILLQPPSSITDNCELQGRLAIQLPDELFLDPDELDDKFAGSAISSYRLSTTVNQHQKESWRGRGRVKVDIERPCLYSSTLNGSNGVMEYTILNLDIIPPEPHIQTKEEGESGGSTSSKVEIPLHGRYLLPTEDGQTIIKFPNSIESKIRGEWICKLGPDAVPQSSSLPLIEIQPLEIILPTGKHSHQPFVELITPLIIWSGWGWLVYKISRLRNRIISSRSLARSKKGI